MNFASLSIWFFFHVKFTWGLIDYLCVWCFDDALLLQVVLGHATHLYFDHPYEPDPEERGFYWATRFTDTRKVFGYVPSDIYKNADIAGNGTPLTQDQICTNNGTCLQLEKPENIIGKMVLIIIDHCYMGISASSI